MKTLITILIIYLILRLSSKYLLPILLKQYLKNVKRKFEQQQGTANTPKNGSKINIKYPSKSRFHQERRIEYTEFEEIETDQKQ